MHVLLALAVLASVFIGNSLEGGLLLAMFNLTHIAEEYFTSRAMVDVKELKENNPAFALVLEVNGDGPPHFSDLAYSEVPVHDIEVGSYILVRAGEVLLHEGGTLLVCLNSIRALNNLSWSWRQDLQYMLNRLKSTNYNLEEFPGLKYCPGCILLNSFVQAAKVHSKG